MLQRVDGLVKRGRRRSGRPRSLNLVKERPHVAVVRNENGDVNGMTFPRQK